MSRGVLGAHEDADVLADELLLGVPEEVGRRGVRHRDRPPLVDDEDAVDGRFEHGRQQGCGIGARHGAQATAGASGPPRGAGLLRGNRSAG